MLRILVSILTCLSLAITARLFALLASSVHLGRNVFQSTWDDLNSNSLLYLFEEFFYSDTYNLRSILIAPFLEGLFLVSVLKVAEKIKAGFLTGSATILVLSYFLHGEGLAGFNATIGFAFFLVAYYIYYSIEPVSSIRGYVYSSITHCFFNLFGAFFFFTYLSARNLHT